MKRKFTPRWCERTWWCALHCAAAGPEEDAARIGAAARRGVVERLGAAGLTEATAAPGESLT